MKDVRIALDDGGHARGFAFVEFEDTVSTLIDQFMALNPDLNYRMTLRALWLRTITN